MIFIVAQVTNTLCDCSVQTSLCDNKNSCSWQNCTFFLNETYLVMCQFGPLIFCTKYEHQEHTCLCYLVCAKWSVFKRKKGMCNEIVRENCLCALMELTTITRCVVRCKSNLISSQWSISLYFQTNVLKQFLKGKNSTKTFIVYYFVLSFTHRPPTNLLYIIFCTKPLTYSYWCQAEP